MFKVDDNVLIAQQLSGGGSSQRGKCFNYNLGLIFLDVHSLSRGMGCFNSCIVKI